ncbi:HdeD family acid-resistance protein [Mycobacterium sp.]|uniref:HdeD family acid-resistance protein n=1 Tax=Mycobacterium sp. TaxID=1785 RepID=UPI002BED2CFE|nr:DUF308 domain-containing protein [Mycobacterium sp.]HTY34609.1 DUF308 domain-containing protein [Mycobacterium sp.]
MTSAPTLVGHPWKSLLASGLLSLSVGAAVLAWPKPSIVVASILFGVILVFSGTEQLVFAFTVGLHDANRTLMIFSGVLSLILAMLAFRRLGQGSAVLVLAFCIGVGLLFQGYAHTVLAISHPELPGRGRYIILGLTTAIAGVVVVVWPFRSITVLAVVAGICLVLVGIAQITWSRWGRMALRRNAALERLPRTVH